MDFPLPTKKETIETDKTLKRVFDEGGQTYCRAANSPQIFSDGLTPVQAA
jgi:hypothetical protein